MKVALDPSQKEMAFNFTAFVVVGYDVMVLSCLPLVKGDSSKSLAKVVIYAYTFCSKVFIDIC